MGSKAPDFSEIQFNSTFSYPVKLATAPTGASNKKKLTNCSVVQFLHLHETLFPLATGHKLAGFQQPKEYSPSQEQEILIEHQDYPEPLLRQKTTTQVCKKAFRKLSSHACGWVKPLALAQLLPQLNNISADGSVCRKLSLCHQKMDIGALLQLLLVRPKVGKDTDVFTLKRRGSPQRRLFCEDAGSPAWCISHG